MVAKAVQDKFGNWNWVCLDCKHEWSSDSYQCPGCSGINTERTFELTTNEKR